jgi:hypothetical protein
LIALKELRTVICKLCSLKNFQKFLEITNNYATSTYDQLLNKCKEKDKEIKRLNYMVKSLKSDVDLQNTAKCDGFSNGIKKRYQKWFRCGPFNVSIKSEKPLNMSGTRPGMFKVQVGWLSRVVVILKRNVVDKTILVGNDESVWTLFGAYSQLSENEYVVGKEFLLKADCFLCASVDVAKHFSLSYKEAGFLHPAKKQIAKVQDLLALCFAKEDKILVVCDHKDDFYDFKVLLGCFLKAISSFETFSSFTQRKMELQRIQKVKMMLLDENLLRLHVWSYLDLLSVWEWRGWKANNNPYTKEDIYRLENLNQEGEALKRQIIKLVRHEMERRDHAGDDDGHNSSIRRKRWMLPGCDLNCPGVPWEVEDRVTKLPNANIKSVSKIAEDVINCFFVKNQVENTVLRSSQLDAYKFGKSILKNPINHLVNFQRIIQTYNIPSAVEFNVRPSSTHIKEMKWVKVANILQGLYEDGPYHNFHKFAPVHEWKLYFQNCFEHVTKQRTRNERTVDPSAAGSRYKSQGGQVDGGRPVI